MNPVPSDAELIDGSKAGQLEAFGLLVERYQNLVCAVAFSATRDRALSEDVGQETFVAAWTSLSTIQEPAKLKGWLCGTARNLSKMALRKRRREVTGSEDVPELVSTDTSAFDELVDHERATSVQKALEKIPEPYRETLVLYYREDKSISQVADGLGISEDAVKQRLSRGRQSLKQQVSDLLEQTLASTKPRKAFTAGVLAIIGARAGVGTAAAANASSRAGGRSQFTKGQWRMKILKAAAVAAPIMLLVLASTSLLSRASEHTANKLGVSEAQVRPGAVSPVSVSPRAGVTTWPVGQATGGAAPNSTVAAPRASRDPEKSGIIFSLVFSDADKKHSKELHDAIMPKVGETLDTLAECYLAFIERHSDLRKIAGQVSVDVDLVEDSALGGISVDTHYRAHLGTKTDAEFDECMKESSFAVDYQAGQGTPKAGTVRIVMEFPDGAPDKEEASRACFEELKRRRPDISLSGTINDAAFASCMDKAVGAAPLMNSDVDPRAQACYDDARRRLPHANFEEIAKDDTFLACLNHIPAH